MQYLSDTQTLNLFKLNITTFQIGTIIGLWEIDLCILPYSKSITSVWNRCWKHRPCNYYIFLL